MSDTGYIEQKIGVTEGLRHSLEGIRNRGHISRQPVPYLHKDDHNFGNLMGTVKTKLKEQSKSGAMRLGVVVGTGAMLSIASDVDVDAWLVLDNNNFVLEWSEQTVQALRQQPNRSGYTSQVYSGSLAQEAKSNRIDPNEWLEIEKQALGRLHFLNSDSRFDQAK